MYDYQLKRFIVEAMLVGETPTRERKIAAICDV